MLAKLGEWRRFAGWIGVMALAAWVLGRGAAGGAVGQMSHVQTAGQEPIRFVTLQ